MPQRTHYRVHSLNILRGKLLATTANIQLLKSARLNKPPEFYLSCSVQLNDSKDSTIELKMQPTPYMPRPEGRGFTALLDNQLGVKE